MPVQTNALSGGKVSVSTPGGVKAKRTTKKKAKRLERLLNAIEHGWKPKKKKKKKVTAVHGARG